MPTTRKLTDNIEETVQLIYDGLQGILDLQPRERLLGVLEKAYAQYNAKGWRRKRVTEFEQLLSELRQTPFKEHQLDDFIDHFNNFVIHPHGGLKSNSANTLILRALAEEYACKPQENVKSSMPKGGFSSLDAASFSREVAPLLCEHLRRKLPEQTAVLDTTPVVKVHSKINLSLLGLQKKISFVFIPAQATPSVVDECAKKAHALADERSEDYVCLVDTKSVSWCPPGGDRRIPLSLTGKKMEDFLCASDDVKCNLVQSLIQEDVLKKCKVYFNKATESISENALRETPYIVFYDAEKEDPLRLVRLDIRGRETPMPVSSLLRTWVNNHLAELQKGDEAAPKLLALLRPLLCGLSLPKARPLEEELRKTAEQALKNQLKVQSQAQEASLPGKLDMTQFVKIASIFGEQDPCGSPKKRNEAFLEASFIEEIAEVFADDIPPAPPLPFRI